MGREPLQRKYESFKLRSEVIMTIQNPEYEALLDNIVVELRQTQVPTLPELHIDFGEVIKSEPKFIGSFGQRLLSRRSLVVAASILIALTLLFPYWSSSNALAQVQNAIRNARSIRFTIETLVDNEVVESRQVLLAGERGVRAESVNSLLVFAAATQEILEVDHASRTALLTPVYDSDAMKRDLASAIGRLASLEPIKETKVREVVRDGKQVTEISAVWDSAVVVATLASASNLPLRLEIDRGRTPNDKSIRETITNIEFDVPISEHLFATRPPADYELEKVSKVDLDDATKELIVSDRGLGPVMWGMTRDAVIAKLGKPDRIKTSPGMETVMKDGKPVLTPGVGAGIKMVPADPPWELVVLHYDSRGYRITLQSNAGMTSVRCYDARIASPFCRRFEGQTSKGIRIGMPKSEVTKRLDGKEPPIGQFDFRDGRLVAFAATKRNSNPESK